ncbi:MAG: TIGR04053 family radical SAM/SPASM domain-containing protein [Candidatus Hydrothermarchaeaceae archaeon]
MAKKPVSIMWESTIACGLKCKHCKASAKKTPEPDELTTDEAKQLIDQIVAFKKPYPILRITGGNALTRTDIFDLIKYARDSGISATIAPSTSPHLNRKNIIRLKEAGTEVVAMSIDGPTAESHDSFRGVPGTFDRLVHATKVMNEIGLPFRILTTVSKFNVRDIPKILMLSKKLGAIGFYLYMLIPTGRAREEYEITPHEYEDVFSFIYDLMRSSPITVNAIAGSEPYRRVAVIRRLIEEGKVDEGVLNHGRLYKNLKEGLNSLLASEKSAPDNTGTFKPRDKKFGKGIFVSQNGAVYPTSFLPIEIGSVRTEELKDIYPNSTLLKEMQDARKLKGRCRVCEFNDICRGSRSRAYASTGDYLAEDPACIYTPGTIGKIADNAAILRELHVTNFSRMTV